jgi:hypothetical protein
MLGKITLGMRRVSLALFVAMAGTVLLAAGSADAAPLALGKSAIAQSEALDGGVILVRDGCGRGMRYSNRRGGCVPQDRGGVDPAAAIIGGVIGGVLAPRRGDGCPRGWRFSNSRGRCVPM